MKPKKFTALCLTACLLPGLALADAHNSEKDRFAPVKIVPTKVTDKIYMLTGQGGNIGVLLGKDGTFVIDDQFAPLNNRIVKAIESIGGDIPRYLVNTHYHGDHTGGNEAFGRRGATIVAHDHVRKRLVDGSYISAFGMKSPPVKEVGLPSLTFSETMHFHINGETVKAIHTPNAHTDGDSFIVFENANVIHTGDLFFNGFYPFIDGAHGGSVRGVIEAVEQMLALSDEQTKIIPGHGSLASRADLEAYHDMLSTAYRNLLKLKNSGVSAADAAMEGPMDEFDEAWADGMFTSDRWIQVIYPAIY